MVKIAILGFGTVGSGVYEVIRKNENSIKRKAGKRIEIGYILDIRDFSGHREANLFTKDYSKILSDDKVKIVVEVMGGLNPAYEYTKAALLAGKSVVTSNKELVSTHGAELLKIAADKGVNYLFEASVGGGIPIIRPLNECLAANEIEKILGILNGTTNYILTKMIKEGETFENALSDAQKKGYAERDPSADVKGHDACRKICILASLAFGRKVDCKGVLTEGIIDITLDDVKYASALGCVIKLIGYTERIGDKVAVRVSPMMLPKEHPLSGTEDVFNAILVGGDSIGDVMFYGQGAGKLPTASAVVGDIIDAAKSLNINKGIMWTDSGQDFVMDAGDINTRLFVRVKADIDKAKEVFGDIRQVSIGKADEVAFITPIGKEKQLLDKIKAIGKEFSFIRMGLE